MVAFTEIYDRALVTMQDYTLDKLAETNYNAFLLFMKSLLKSGIPFFNCCLNSLDYHDEAELEINENGEEVIFLIVLLLKHLLMILNPAF